MKLILIIISILLLLPSLGNVSLDTPNNDFFYAKGRREPTRDEIMVMAFKEETPQAKELLMRESGLNPEAVNKSSSACGLGQSLPCSKMKCELSQDIHDFTCQAFWVRDYVKQRYGEFKTALAWHDANNWY